MDLILFAGLLISAAVWTPLSLKWELPRPAAFSGVVCVGIGAALATRFLISLMPMSVPQALAVEGVLVGGLGAAGLAFRFYRDPERITRLDGQSVMSPADGVVVYVKEVEAGCVPVSKKNGRQFALTELAGGAISLDGGYLIGIGMSYLDVHVNRAPISGDVLLLERIGGAFLSLRLKSAVLLNERVVTVLGNQRMRVAMVQIASRMVRRIVPYVRNGDEVVQGQRIGRITFGSQVDVILPASPEMRVLVRPGQRVTAGLTVLASVVDAGVGAATREAA